MAQGFKFVSPGVKFAEQDLTFVQKSAGITTLGIVGEFPKGPAFEPILISDKGQLKTRFGNLNPEELGGQPRFQGSYVANAYLEESQQLYVTRVLGLSGYDAGKGWALTLSAGVNYSTTGSTTVTNQSGVTFTNNTYNGEVVDTLGQSGFVFTGFTKTSATGFAGYVTEYLVTGITGSTGKLSLQNTRVTGTSYTEYEKMVLAIIRSRADVEDVDDAEPVTTFKTTTLTIINNTTDDASGDLFGSFTLRATNGVVTEDYEVSLNPNSRDYVVNVIGDKPRGNNARIYVEAIFPDLIKKLDGDGFAYGVNTTPVILDNSIYKDYESEFTTPETPFVVSELRGNSVARLFKFISISDGDSANREIKISFENINPATKEFDVIIRDFNDTDDTLIPLETFRRCSMRKSLNNYIGKRIGDGVNYDLKSAFVYLEFDENAPEDAFPAGFEGYNFRSFASGYTATAGVQAPKIHYKTSYDQSEKVKRAYLGISEKAYNSASSKGTSVNPDLFKFYGAVQTGFTKTKGFHMDSGATGTYSSGNVVIGQFEVGAGKFRKSSDVLVSSSPYNVEGTRKFTVVPYGGFDGWNEHRISRTNTDLYAIGQAFDGVADNATVAYNDYQAWEAAIATFENTEAITINLFTTPGINWSDNLSLVREAIEMIEERADTLYIIDAPRLKGSEPQDIVDLLDIAEIDSSYAATYYPWIKVNDSTNNRNVFLPPTLEIVKSIAYNDNIAFPWYAPAGLQRGVTDATGADATFAQDDRDVLYNGRINPMAKFNNVGVAIFGQKTLQIRESALDRINVRRLILQLKVLISNIAIRLVFEQNDQATIDEFLKKVNPILDRVKRERGLEEFRVVMDDTNNSPESRDRNELYGSINIKPVKAVEFIGLTFNISPSGASFADQ